MKKILAVLIASVMAITMFGALTVSADQPTNYLTTKWSNSLFGGNLEETEEDGAVVTTYTFSSKQPWISSNISVYGDIKKLAEGKDYVEVVFSVEIRGVFSGENNATYCESLLRAVNPRTNYISYPAGDAGNWNGEGATWQELFDEGADDEKLFAVDTGGNCMFNFTPQTIEILGDEWTLYETDPVYLPSGVFNDDLYSDWLWCFHQIDFGTGLEAIQIRNAAIYDENENRKTPAPTAEPTEKPTEDAPEATTVPATDAPVVTDAPATEASQPQTTPGTGDNTQEKSGVNPGLIIGIICAVVVIAAVVAFILIKKKKK